ncbi:unnamed protein product, partial [Mesorhabditis spiculigera]
MISRKTFNELTFCKDAVVTHLADRCPDKDPEELEPTKVQSLVHPFFQRRSHVLVRAPTGSGKTIAFLAPIFDILAPPVLLGSRKAPRALVVIDTRDLCRQHTCVATQLSNLTDGRLTVACHMGGNISRIDCEKYKAEQHIIVNPPNYEYDILFMSPGKLIEAIQRKIDFSQLEFIVFDEADELFDGGKFQEEFRYLKEELEKLRAQPTFRPAVSFFSATLDPESQQVQRGLSIVGLENLPVEELGFVYVDRQHSVTQLVFKVAGIRQKLHLLEILLEKDLKRGGSSNKDPNKHTHVYPNATLVFCNTRAQAWFVYMWLKQKDFPVAVHTGKMNDSARNSNLTGISDGRVPICIASDALARGLDKPNVDHVILYQLPNEKWDKYDHRVGRAGRAGRPGTCSILFDANHRPDLMEAGMLLAKLRSFGQKVPAFLTGLGGHVEMVEASTQDSTEDSRSNYDTAHEDELRTTDSTTDADDPSSDLSLSNIRPPMSDDDDDRDSSQPQGVADTYTDEEEADKMDYDQGFRSTGPDLP